MPREQINYPDLTEKARQIELRAAHAAAEADIPQPAFGPWNESAVHVGWQAGPLTTSPPDEPVRSGPGWVQLGLEVDITYAQFALASPNGATDDRTVMWTPVLTDDEVDKLLKVLRKAKRHARVRPAEGTMQVPIQPGAVIQYRDEKNWDQFALQNSNGEWLPLKWDGSVISPDGLSDRLGGRSFAVLEALSSVD